jgi:hypothetical protein
VVPPTFRVGSGANEPPRSWAAISGPQNGRWKAERRIGFGHHDDPDAGQRRSPGRDRHNPGTFKTWVTNGVIPDTLRFSDGHALSLPPARGRADRRGPGISRTTSARSRGCCCQWFGSLPPRSPVCGRTHSPAGCCACRSTGGSSCCSTSQARSSGHARWLRRCDGVFERAGKPERNLMSPGIALTGLKRAALEHLKATLRSKARRTRTTRAARGCRCPER